MIEALPELRRVLEKASGSARSARGSAVLTVGLNTRQMTDRVLLAKPKEEVNRETEVITADKIT